MTKIQQAIANHIKAHKPEMGTAIALVGLTALVAAVLVPLTFIGHFKTPMQNWMNHTLKIGGTRWMWIAGGGSAATALALGAFGLSFRKPKAKNDEQPPTSTPPPATPVITAPAAASSADANPVASPVVTPPSPVPAPGRRVAEEGIPAGWVKIVFDDPNDSYYWNDDSQQSVWFKDEIPVPKQKS